MGGKLIVILDCRVKELRYGEAFLLLDLLCKTPYQGDLNIIFLMYLFRGLAFPRKDLYLPDRERLELVRLRWP